MLNHSCIYYVNYLQKKKKNENILFMKKNIHYETKYLSYIFQTFLIQHPYHFYVDERLYTQLRFFASFLYHLDI